MGYNQKITKEIEWWLDSQINASLICPSTKLCTRIRCNREDLGNLQGEGVRAGLTRISEITSFKGKRWKIFRRRAEISGGIDIHEITDGFLKEERFGFEEVAYLMLRSLPTEAQLKASKPYLASKDIAEELYKGWPSKAPSKGYDNTSRSVLTLYAYGYKGWWYFHLQMSSDSINLIATFPMMCVYDMHTITIRDKVCIYIIFKWTSHCWEHSLWCLERFVQSIQILIDLAMVYIWSMAVVTTHLHNSCSNFIRYRHLLAIAAALWSLKGPKHGGANIKVVRCSRIWKRISWYKWWRRNKIISFKNCLEKEAFDKQDLYMVWVTPYSISLTRATFSSSVNSCPCKVQRQWFQTLQCCWEAFAPEVIGAERHIH